MTQKLPPRFAKAKTLLVFVAGQRVQTSKLFPGRRARVKVKGLKCGVYPFIVAVKGTRIPPVLRIWVLTGGKGLARTGFPFPVPPPGLS